MLEFTEVNAHDLGKLHEMARLYLQELSFEVLEGYHDPVELDGYLTRRFSFDDTRKSIYWAKVDENPVGFAMFRVSEDGKQAFIHDFFILPEERRNGFGTMMINWLLKHFQYLGVKRVDLHVRLDNSPALNFWEKNRFEIVQYRLRLLLDTVKQQGFHQ